MSKIKRMTTPATFAHRETEASIRGKRIYIYTPRELNGFTGDVRTLEKISIGFAGRRYPIPEFFRRVGKTEARQLRKMFRARGLAHYAAVPSRTRTPRKARSWEAHQSATGA